MFSLWYAVYLFGFSLILALMEIQIEGKYGWAKKAPCWRPKQELWIAKLYTKLLGDDKPLTGYHITFNSGILAALHFPFFAGLAWSSTKEMVIISSFFLISVFEDFLWFVWNPHYGVRKFNSRNPDIWWMKEWILGVIPKCYIKGIGVSAIFAGIAISFGDLNIFAQWGTTLGILGGLTLISYIISLLLKIGQEKIGRE